MTFRELYLSARHRLSGAGIEDPGFEAAALARHILGLDRAGLALHGHEPASASQERAMAEALEQREARRPLQYILGQWDFMGLTLKVGEGVLVPREDTAVLVEALAARLRGRGPVAHSPRGLDLCAGTGAVGLGICSLVPEAEVTCLELDGTAMGYLEANLARYPQYHVTALRGDILSPETASGFAELDFIASNPPYIAREELPGLQPEVQKEPMLALDGGEDGLVFYRAIGGIWAPKLRPGGVLGVEIGETQAGDVAEIFREAGLRDIAVHRDLAGLDRAVTAIR